MNTKALRRWIGPAVILVIALFVNRVLGLILVIGYIAFMLWSSRSGLISQIAVRKYRQGDLAGALEWFSKAAAAKNANATVLLSYALVLVKVGRFDDAAAQVERASKQELSDYNRNALEAMRGFIEWKTGSPAKAAVDLASLAEEFRNRNLFGVLGSLYLSEGKLDDALQFNLDAFDYDPYDSVIVDNLARTYYLSGDIEEAESTLDELLSREPMIPEPYINKALILESRGELDEAARLADRARRRTYSHLSYFSQDEIEEICDRIESNAEAEE